MYYFLFIVLITEYISVLHIYVTIGYQTLTDNRLGLGLYAVSFFKILNIKNLGFSKMYWDVLFKVTKNWTIIYYTL